MRFLDKPRITVTKCPKCGHVCVVTMFTVQGTVQCPACASIVQLSIFDGLFQDENWEPTGDDEGEEP